MTFAMTTAMPGLGKTAMAMDLMRQMVQQGQQVLVVSMEAGLPGRKDRQAPAPHDPSHTPTQRLGEGIRRVCARLGGLRHSQAQGLAYAAQALSQAGQQARLWKLRGQEHQVWPSQGRSPRHARTTRPVWRVVYLVQTRQGYFDAHGRHSFHPNDAVRQAGLPLKRATLERVPRKEQEQLVANLSWMGGTYSYMLRDPHVLEDLAQEMQVAMLEGSTPIATASTTIQRL